MAFSFVPPISKDPIYTQCVETTVGVCECVHGGRCARTRKLSKLDEFLVEFARELDIFDSKITIPDWVHKFWLEQIEKLSSKQMKFYRWLKENGYKFKIKYPVCINSQWKFADAMLSDGTIIIFANPVSNFRPAGLVSYRAEWFKGHYDVIEVETIDEIKHKLTNLKTKCRSLNPQSI